MWVDAAHDTGPINATGATHDLAPVALIGPVSWAASTHIDKYLVDKYFKDSDTAVLMVFTAVVGVVALPVIWVFEPASCRCRRLPLAS